MLTTTTDVLLTKIPEIVIAKKNELEMEYYEAYEEVDMNNQHVLGSRSLVVVEKNDKIKARFVLKGFKERGGDPRSDSPTASYSYQLLLMKGFK